MDSRKHFLNLNDMSKKTLHPNIQNSKFNEFAAQVEKEENISEARKKIHQKNWESKKKIMRGSIQKGMPKPLMKKVRPRRTIQMHPNSMRSCLVTSTQTPKSPMPILTSKVKQTTIKIM